MAFICGIGLASGISTHPEYSAAYSRGQGALIVEGFGPLNGFGKFCSVVVALGLIANTVAPTYSSGVDFQILGRYAEKVPRVIWNTIAVVIYTVCALVGRSNLAEIFTNFLALMGYWVAIWAAIMVEERYIFRGRAGYNWAVWRDPSKLPIGAAGFTAFVVGWVGAILCMAQVWYIGPLASLVGKYGADVCSTLFRVLLLFLTFARWEITSASLGLRLSILLCGTLNAAGSVAELWLALLYTRYVSAFQQPDHFAEGACLFSLACDLIAVYWLPHLSSRGMGRLLFLELLRQFSRVSLKN